MKINLETVYIGRCSVYPLRFLQLQATEKPAHSGLNLKDI